jgi:hypothetical protein
MAAGMDADNDAICRNPRNQPTEGDGIVDARTEMKLDYAPGRSDPTLSDFVCGVLLCGISQRIHFIQCENSKHANRAHRQILTAPIRHLGLKDRIRNMYPVTADHLLQFILQE